MSTPTSLPQIIKLWQVLGEPNSERFQYLLANGDLLKALLEAGSSLQQVDREAFQTLLHPSLVSTRIGHSVVEAAWAQPTWQTGDSQLPDWYVHPDLQLEQQESWLRSLGFGQGDVPTSGPVGVTPTDRALPLLKIITPGSRRVSSCRRTIDVHMAAIEQQLVAMGRKIYLWDSFKLFQEDPRLVGGLVDSEPGISWVLFNPFAHWDSQNGHRVADLPTFQDDWKLAASESLSALKVWPKYGPTMDGSKTPYINLAGFRTASGDVPYADWWADDGELHFLVYSADVRDRGYASPRFRECWS